MQAKVAELKQSLAANQKALQQYTWVETTEISMKGEVKKTEQKECRYGTDGKVVKTDMGGGTPQQAANGESVLIYPGADGPVASARLEQIRDGIEDWDVLDVVRRKRGPPAVRTILGNAGLFSTTAQGAKLACTVGCELHGPTRFSWPQWSHDASTAQKIEAAHLQALRAAAG